MSFKDELKNDVQNCLLNTSEFAEDITYIPYGQPSRSIKAIVVRNRVDGADEVSSRVLSNQIEIYIFNDGTNGVTSVDRRNDVVILPEIIGGDNVDWAVIDILDNDSAMWHLLLQK